MVKVCNAQLCSGSTHFTLYVGMTQFMLLDNFSKSNMCGMLFDNSGDVSS